jgi:ABC-type uncharacterized transport system YnjBCD ATPase subunit
MIQKAIQVQNLEKCFGEFAAVKGVSFEVRQGEIFSLLGPNGAGKSTTISMLSCLLVPSGGDAWVMGHSIRSEAQAVKANIGIVPQDIALYGDLSAQNLSFWGKMYGLRCACKTHRRSAGNHRADRSAERQIRRVEIIAGHVVAMFLIIFAQQLILVLVGHFVFRVDYLRQPLAILLMIIVLSFWAASLGLLISPISRKEDQVITLSLIAMFIFAAMGAPGSLWKWLERPLLRLDARCRLPGQWMGFKIS